MNFDYQPEDMKHSFFVVENKNFTEIFECYDEDDKKLRIVVPKNRWKEIKKYIIADFNYRLRQQHKHAGHFSKDGTHINYYLGMEMMIFLWGMETREDEELKKAYLNWSGLRPEEKWWLYTMTNAATGSIGDFNRGWRVALAYILCENPVTY